MKKQERASQRRMSQYEMLESRVLFDAVYPTPAEQYSLALINRARGNPVGEVARLATSTDWKGTPDLNEGQAAGTITPDAKQPLALNPNLTDAARKHSQWMITTKNFSHDEGTMDVQSREVAAGYVFSGANWLWSENIGGLTSTDPSGMALDAESGFFIDSRNLSPGRGHRNALMDPGLNEIGIGIAFGSTNYGGNAQITEDFGNAGSGSFLTGYVINDINQNNFYDPGEGLGGVTITATRTADNAIFSSTTWAAGGYSLKLDPGTYVVTASGGAVGTPAMQTITVGTSNVEADFAAAIVAPVTPAAPVFTGQTLDLTIAKGNSATFAASAVGNPVPAVQWQVSSSGGAFTNIAGATGQVYSFTPTADQTGNRYQAVVSNSQGTITSTPAGLTITGLPLTLVVGPQSQISNVGDPVTFTSLATGSGVTTQWSVSTDGGATFTDIPGATSPNLTFTATAAQSGNAYQVTITDIRGAASAGSASLTVNAAPVAPTITAQPTATAATANGTATVAVAATGFPVNNVQWQVAITATPAGIATLGLNPAQSSTVVYTDIPGATGSTLTLPVTSADNREKVRAVITNDNGTVFSDVVILSVNSKTPLANDVTSLQAAAHAALAAITVCARATENTVSALRGDLSRLHASKSNCALLSTLVRQERALRAKLGRDEIRFLSLVTQDAIRANADSVRLGRHTNSAKLKAKLDVDLVKLQRDSASTPVPADATSCRVATASAVAPLQSVDIKDTGLQLDIEAAHTNAVNIGQALQAPVTIVQQILTRVMSDAGGL